MSSIYPVLFSQIADLSSQMLELEGAMNDIVTLSELPEDSYNSSSDHRNSFPPDKGALELVRRDPLHNYGCFSLISGQNLRFQLKLNSLGDLHRLLSAQLILDGVAPPDFIPAARPPSPKNNQKANRCTLLKWSFPKPLEDKDLRLPPKSLVPGRRLLDHLFHVYTSECFLSSYMPHPNRAAFLESYYRGKIEPALLHTACAYAAIHLLLMHAETPTLKQVRTVVGDLVAKAKACLEESFDSPSPYVVLAFLNMEACMRVLSRINEAYMYHTQAALMALALRMDIDDPSEHDAARIEFHRRIWSFLCRMEILNVYMDRRRSIIPLDVIRKSTRASVKPNESKRYKIFMLNLMVDIISCSKFAHFTDIDWTLPDAAIAQKLFSITAFLQQEHILRLKQGSEHKLLDSDMLFTDISSTFWIHWCCIWQLFIESDIPPRRLETDLMKQLQAKAYEEYAKGVFNATHHLEASIRGQDWCKFFPYTIIRLHVICQMHKFVARKHPDRAIRREAFRQLAKILQLLRSLPKSRRMAEQWFVNEVLQALEEMKPMVFTSEEFEEMRAKKPSFTPTSKLKSLAIKRCEDI
ncbi:uncharacterized protein VTP21DRAFT_11301 [Calcarisporiella thermophila]|uniref:uncharacterized protein n=1 Tax=Calcarisporiella thermophila TaxID=911321 RepID=UPI0037424502